MTIVLFALVLLRSPVWGQLPSISDVNGDAGAGTTGPLPAWDVAVIKPHAAADPSMSWKVTEDSVEYHNLSLKQMICSAWDLKSYEVSGLSGWMEGTSFDLTAKVSEDDLALYKKLNIEQRRQMLQKLIVERFQLKFHTETKTMPVFDLVVDRGGSKLQTTTAVTAPSPEEERAHPEKYRKGSWSTGSGSFDAAGVPVRTLASHLADVLEEPVHDKTGLTGTYDMKLRYRPQESTADKGEDTDAPSLFAAVQEQLGLRLVSGKGAVQTLVVESAQRPEVD